MAAVSFETATTRRAEIQCTVAIGAKVTDILTYGWSRSFVSCRWSVSWSVQRGLGQGDRPRSGRRPLSEEKDTYI